MRLVLSIILIAMMEQNAFGQSTSPNLKPLKGIVLGSGDDDLLVGVHIYAKIAHVGTTSDAQGIFRMKVDPQDTLVVTFVGYHRQIIPLAYFREDQIDLVISMESATIELDGITIYSDPNIDYLKRQERSALRVPGLQAPSEKPDVDVPVGSLNYGIMSRWGKEAKEKRKLMKVYPETQRHKIYIKTVSSDSVRAIFLNQYDLTENQYNDFIIFFNTNDPFMNRQDPEDIVRAMHQTFLRYRPKRD